MRQIKIEGNGMIEKRSGMIEKRSPGGFVNSDDFCEFVEIKILVNNNYRKKNS